MSDEDIKRIKRLSRKRIPMRPEREEPRRSRDSRKFRHSAKEDIRRYLEEESEEEDLEIPEEGPGTERTGSID